MRRRLIAGLVLIGIAPCAARSQQLPQRDGYWFSFNVGAGRMQCDECVGSFVGPAAGIAFGTALHETVLLGIAADAWGASVQRDDGTIQSSGGDLVLRVTPMARWYPANRRVGISAGAGLAMFNAGARSITPDGGTSVVVGVDYELPSHTSLKIAPFGEYVVLSARSRTTKLAQLGVRFSFY